MFYPRYQATAILDANDNMWVFGGTYPGNEPQQGKNQTI
jgi:hypothetical protein